MLELRNLNEPAVVALVSKLIESENMCKCEHCKMDICAIALNYLQPRYVVTDQGGVFGLVDSHKTQSKVELYSAILRAIELVKKNPRHTTNNE